MQISMLAKKGNLQNELLNCSKNFVNELIKARHAKKKKYKAKQSEAAKKASCYKMLSKNVTIRLVHRSSSPLQGRLERLPALLSSETDTIKTTMTSQNNRQNKYWLLFVRTHYWQAYCIVRCKINVHEQVIFGPVRQLISSKPHFLSYNKHVIDWKPVYGYKIAVKYVFNCYKINKQEKML